MEFPQHKCETCGATFAVKSNLTRHAKTHAAQEHECDICHKRFTLKQHLDRHVSTHQYPEIPLYRPGEARIQPSTAARHYGRSSTKDPVDKLWENPATAEEEAKRQAGDQWRLRVLMTFGKYKGKSFKWLMENDIGMLLPGSSLPLSE